MKLKFCGLKTMEDINYFNQYPADYIGFVFAESKRMIDKKNAVALKGALEISGVQVVGVFLNQSLEEVADITGYVGLDVIQLHGSEDNAYIESLRKMTGKEIWKALKSTPEELSRFNDSNADKILIDSASGGGSGQKADWQLISEHMAGFNKPFILAGGLNAGNIEAAIRLLEPFGLDLSSGIECNGIKNLELMKEIYRKVKDYGK